MRRYQEPIQVVLHEGNGPATITWRGRTYAVLVIGRWRLSTRWWDEARATDRTYYRVETGDHQVFEIYHDAVTGAWILDVCHD